MTTWMFILIVHTATFGGQVTAQLETLTQASCQKLRRVIIQELGGEHNINGSVSACQPSRTLKETP